MLGFVAAGMPIEAVASAESISVPESLVAGRRDTYVLRVRGESMIEEGIHDGDIVIVRQQDDARNGDIVVALVDGDATVKFYYREGEKVRLQPANSKMDPIWIDAANTTALQGVVVGVYRRYQ